MLHFNGFLIALVVTLLLMPSVLAQQSEIKPASAGQSPMVYLATLEWPPYSSEHLPNGGETVEKVVSVFKRMGYDPQIEFLPWSRAVRGTSGVSPTYLGFFPEYPSENSHFMFSDSLGESVIGLVHKKSRKLDVTTFTALTKYRLGVVKDYINTPEIDRLIQSGAIKPNVAINDRQNLVSLLNDEIDIAVIDERVMLYILENDTELKLRAKAKFVFDKTLSRRQTLHLAFSRYHPESALFEHFNATLQQINLEFQSSNLSQSTEHSTDF
jgi:polar amino acid transport system substrate-binding protein